VNVNPSVTKKDKIEGVLYPLPVLDRRHPCLPIEKRGVRDRLDLKEDGRKMNRRKTAKAFHFLHNIVSVRLLQRGTQ
jgi:hypothetical protein